MGFLGLMTKMADGQDAEVLLKDPSPAHHVTKLGEISLLVLSEGHLTCNLPKTFGFCEANTGVEAYTGRRECLL